VKVTMMLDELPARGFAGAEYDAWYIDILKGDQFGSGIGHFCADAPVKIDNCIDRFTMEVKRRSLTRQLSLCRS
jgi:GST-like protein